MLAKSLTAHFRAASAAFACLSLIFVVYLCLCCSVQPVLADVEWFGDIDPDDPTTWTSETDGYVGKDSSGTLDITAGSGVIDSVGYIGYWLNSPGRVTVDGEGSTWKNCSDLFVGCFGSGNLNITDNGIVTVDGITWIAHYPDSSGTIHFDNGTLSTGGLLCARDDLSGAGTINTHGLVSDVDLVFNATYGLHQILNLAGNPGQDITIDLNVDGSGAMGAGHSGVGTMSISHGRAVQSTYGYIGYKSGSIGEVTVDGVGSMWTNSESFYAGSTWPSLETLRVGLYVGDGGNGNLNIINGGVVNNRSYGYIA